MGATFESRDMSDAVFTDVNLAHALFNDVNLEGASIKDANLKDFAIEDAFIKGMTIYGIRVDLLIEAELDRRDPERVPLRITNSNDPEQVRIGMSRLDELRSRFYQLLRSTDSAILGTRPSSDQWSVIEIVRHLVFAEELYLNRWILGNDEPFSREGQLPNFLVDDSSLAEVGSEPTDDLERVLDAWSRIHSKAQEFVAAASADQLRRDTSEIDFGQGTVGGILNRMAQHDLVHIRQAERVLRALLEEAV